MSNVQRPRHDCGDLSIDQYSCRADFGLWTLDFGLQLRDFGRWTLNFGLPPKVGRGKERGGWARGCRSSASIQAGDRHSARLVMIARPDQLAAVQYSVELTECRLRLIPRRRQSFHPG